MIQYFVSSVIKSYKSVPRFMTRFVVGRECRLSNLWEDWTPSRIVDPPASGNYKRAVANWTVVLKYHQHPDSSPPAPGDYRISVAIWIVVFKHNHHLDLPGRQPQKIGWEEAIRKIILWLQDPSDFLALPPPPREQGSLGGSPLNQAIL